MAAQFTTNNCRALHNERNYGYINIVRRVQKHFSNAYLKGIRKFSILYKNKTTYICWDDKYQIKVGLPGYPLAISHKSRKAFFPEELQFEASNYNMYQKSHLIPSLFGEVIWDKNDSYTLGDCYNMLVTIVLKEGAIYPSNPFQHAADLILNFCDCKKEYIVLQADGGHDHNCTSWRNIIFFLMIMNELNLQYLIAIKNVRGYSIYNPIERVMGAIMFGS